MIQVVDSFFEPGMHILHVRPQQLRCSSGTAAAAPQRQRCSVSSVLCLSSLPQLSASVLSLGSASALSLSSATSFARCHLHFQPALEIPFLGKVVGGHDTKAYPRDGVWPRLTRGGTRCSKSHAGLSPKFRRTDWRPRPEDIVWEKIWSPGCQYGHQYGP